MTVEGQAGPWYLIVLADGRRGYVHKTVVKLTDEATQVVLAEKTMIEAEKAVKSSEPHKTSQAATPALVTRAEESQPTPAASAAKPQSLLQFLERRQEELLLCLVISLLFFVIGWISGGNYYLKRDKARRSILRF